MNKEYRIVEIFDENKQDIESLLNSIFERYVSYEINNLYELSNEDINNMEVTDYDK